MGKGLKICPPRGLDGFPVFAHEKHAFFYTVVDEIPRQDLLGFLAAVDIEVGIQIHLPEGLCPVALESMDCENQFSHPPVAKGEEGLNVIPLRKVVDNRDCPLAAQALGDPTDPSLDDRRILQGAPLEGRRRLRDKLVDAERQTPKLFSSRRRWRARCSIAFTRRIMASTSSSVSVGRPTIKYSLRHTIS